MFVHDRQTSKTERVSVDSTGRQGNASSVSATISANGRYVLFSSYASNLVPNDTNGNTDFFIRDRLTGKTTRVTHSNGKQGAGTSFSGGLAISANGQFVAFASNDNKLVDGDTNGLPDVFVHDRINKKTTRVSVDSFGHEASGEFNYSAAPAISADGRFITFFSDSPTLFSGNSLGTGSIFLHDRVRHTTTHIGFGDSPSLSADARYLAYSTFGPMANDSGQILVYDTKSHKTIYSLPFGGLTFPAISANGRMVIFVSDQSDLVPNDTNSVQDVFVYDLVKKTTSRVNIDSKGVEANNFSFGNYLSADGRFVTFRSDATNLVSNDSNGNSDVFVHDRLFNKQP